MREEVSRQDEEDAQNHDSFDNGSYDDERKRNVLNKSRKKKQKKEDCKILQDENRDADLTVDAINLSFIGEYLEDNDGAAKGQRSTYDECFEEGKAKKECKKVGTHKSEKNL